MLEEKIVNGFIAVCILAGALFDKVRKHPKLALVFVLLGYSSVCGAMMKFSDSNKSFFTLSACLSLFVAIPLILIYKNEKKPREGRRPEILSTENDWFSERELA
jgi:hypothetical protein